MSNLRGPHQEKSVDVEEIKRLYYEEKLSVWKISERLGYSARIVKDRLHRFGHGLRESGFKKGNTIGVGRKLNRGPSKKAVAAKGVRDTNLRLIADAIAAAGEGCLSGCVYVDPFRAAESVMNALISDHKYIRSQKKNSNA